MSEGRIKAPRLLRAERENGLRLREEGRLRPSMLSAEINLTPLSHAEMRLEQDDLPVNMHDFVELFGQNGSLGIFRVSAVATAYGGQRRVRLEHALGVLGDALIPGEEAFDGTVAQALGRILAAQGEAVWWRLGEVEDAGGYTAENRWGNALQCLTELTRQEDGYYLDFDFSAFPWTLRFLKKSDEAQTEFRLERNADLCRVTLDDSGLCTRLYLAVEDGENGTAYETYDDPEAQAKWGTVSGFERIQADAVPDRAAWARAYLARRARPGLQITIDGTELNRLTGEGMDAVRLGALCRAALPAYGESFLERILTVSYPDLVRQPDRVTVYMADKPMDGSLPYQMLRRRASAVESAVSRNRQEIIKNVMRWRAADQHITDQGTILHEAGLEIDPHGVWLFAREEGALGVLQGSVNTAADKIALVVEETQGGNAIKAASIVAAINGAGSSVIISADKIDLQGYVQASELQTEIGLLDQVNAKRINCPHIVSSASAILAGAAIGSLSVEGHAISFIPITIDGTTYHLLGY